MILLRTLSNLSGNIDVELSIGTSFDTLIRTNQEGERARDYPIGSNS